jgi:Rieske Fe-S protein
MKRIAIVAIALMTLGMAAFGQTATKYFVAHQGGYIGEATVTVDKKGNVVSASIAEWQGPGGWAEEREADGKKGVPAGAVVRVPIPWRTRRIPIRPYEDTCSTSTT